MSAPDTSMPDGPEYGDTWVYEGIIGAIPGLSLDPRTALAIQFVAFEFAVLGLGWFYNLPGPALAGTVAVLVATIGSGALLRIAGQVRGEPMPAPYQRLLFGSNVEVVLSVFAFCALITHLFIVDPQLADETLIESLFGETPPAPAIYLTLLILWDVCYRIGAGWWASVAGLYRSVSFRFDADSSRRLRRVDIEIAGFGLLQLAFVPFLLDQPVLFAGVVGHVLAVIVVTTLSVALLTLRENESTAPYSDS